MRSSKLVQRQRRGARVRARISGSATVPRLVVFRSLKGVEAQLIDDARGQTLAAVNSQSEKKSTGVAAAKASGMALAAEAQKLKVTACVFDRNGYAYHGRVKALAEGAREGGLKF